jgi:hypothetical protein
MECLYEATIASYFPDLDNRTSTIVKNYWHEQKFFLATFQFFIALFLLFSNMLVIIGLFKTNRTLRMSQKLFIVSASVGVTQSVVIPYYAVANFLPNRCLHESIGDAVLNMLIVMDFEALLTLGVIRFISLRSPLTRIKDRTVYVILVLELLFALLVATYSFFSFNSLSPVEFFPIIWLFIGTFLTVCICCGTLLIVALMHVLTKHTKALRSKESFRNHSKAVKRLVSIQAIYIAFSLPVAAFCLHFGFQLSKPAISLKPTRTAKELLFIIWLFPISVLYSGFNSWIYMIKSKQISRYYSKRFFNQEHDTEVISVVSFDKY